MNYRNKYITRTRRKPDTPSHLGCPVRPERWISGPDPIEHDKYYAWLKHKAQARFRKEDHSLTWEDWQELWSGDTWLERGRSMDSLVLRRIDRDLGWHIYNVMVLTRRQVIDMWGGING